MTFHFKASAVVTVFIALSATCPAARGQSCPFDWADGFNLPGLDDDAYASVKFNDGSGDALYVGGMFSIAGGSNVGKVWWVGPEKDTAANPSSNIHLLVSEPFRKVSTDWPNPVHVGDCEFVPQASYGVRAVEVTSGAESAELVVETTQFPPVSPPAPFWWGDVVGGLAFHCNGDIREVNCVDSNDCGGNPCARAWEPPDGRTNVDDLTAALWTSAPAPPTTVAAEFTWVDVHGNDSFTSGSQNFDPPNNKISASDLQQIISGFGGLPYRFYDPADCPDESDWP